MSRHSAPRPCYQHLVVPVNDTDISRAVPLMARELAGLMDARVHLLPLRSPDAAWEPSLVRELELLAEDLAFDLDAAVLDAVTSAGAVGGPVAQIVAFADSLGPDTIVCLGCPARGGAYGPVQGTFVEQVIRAVDRPVLVLGPESLSRPSPIQRVLSVCTDRGRIHHGVPHAATVAQRAAAPLWLLDVLDGDARAEPNGQFRSSPDVLAAARDLRRKHRIATRAHGLIDPYPGETIARLGNMEAGTLIVVPTETTGTAPGSLADGLVDDLVRYAGGPVLVVHRSAAITSEPEHDGFVREPEPEPEPECDDRASGTPTDVDVEITARLARIEARHRDAPRLLARRGPAWRNSAGGDTRDGGRTRSRAAARPAPTTRRPRRSSTSRPGGRAPITRSQRRAAALSRPGTRRHPTRRS